MYNGNQYLCKCGHEMGIPSGETTELYSCPLCKSMGCWTEVADDVEYMKCPVCHGNPRRWLSFDECMANCIHPGSYEDCSNCKDGYVVVSEIECQSCGWEGSDSELSARNSSVEPGCPSCGGGDFLDIEED